MAKALSVDLRQRVIEAIRQGMSRRQAAARFGVSTSSAIRWAAQLRTTGDRRPTGGPGRMLVEGWPGRQRERGRRSRPSLRRRPRGKRWNEHLGGRWTIAQ